MASMYLVSQMPRGHFPMSLKQKINSYFAILLITIAGGGAASIIVHVAFSDTIATRVGVVIHHK